MATVTANELSLEKTLEELITEFNTLRGDVSSVTLETLVSAASSTLVFEGSTDDAYETTLAVVDPTADRTITFPNVTGTVITDANSDTPATTSTFGDLDQFLVNDGGVLKKMALSTIATNLPAITPASANTYALGSASLEWSDLFLGDGAVINFGDDQDVTLTHVHDAGLRLADGDQMQFGTGSDLKIYHDGSNSYISEDGTGQLYIRSNYISFTNAAGNETLTYMDDDGSVSLYFDNSIKLQTLTGGGSLTGAWSVSTSLIPAASDGASLGTAALEWSDLFLADGAVISFGDDQEVTLTHNHDAGLTLNLMIAATTFEPSGDTAAGDNAAIGYTSAEGLILTGQGSSGDITLKNDADAVVCYIPTGTDDLLFPDNAKAMFGAGSDLQIYHNGSHSYISDQGTGSLILQTNNLSIQSADGGESQFASTDDGAVTLYYDNTVALATASAAVNVTGDLTATLTIQPAGDTAAGDNAAIGYTSAEGLILTGQGSTSDVTIKNDADATVCYVPTGADDLRFPDSAKLELGTGADLQIYHDGSDSYISDGGTGDLKIGGATNVKIQNANGSKIMGIFADGGAVTLYYDNAIKFVTETAGGTLTGTLNVSGNILPVNAGGSDLGSTAKEFNDLYLDDSGTIMWGNDQEIRLYHVADAGLILRHHGGGDDKYPSFEFHTSDTDIAVSDKLGAIYFKAPNEASGTDAILTAGGIEVISEGDFSASNNAAKMSFMLGSSAAATEKMSLSSAGLLTIADDLIIKDGGTIGVVSDADSITIDSSGNVTASQNLTVSGNLTVTGTTTTVDTVTMNAQNAVVFEGATADNYETTLSIVDPTADHTQYLINQGGYIPVLAAVTTTAITSTPAELNLLDGSSAGGVVNSKALIYGGSGQVAATTLAVSSTSSFSGHSTHPDNIYSYWGTGDDLRIFHDGSNSYIDDTGTGLLHIRGSQVNINKYTGENMATFAADGAASLFYDNAIKLATTGSGGTLTGTWNVTTELIPDASDGAALGSASYEWSDLFLADGAVIYAGDDQDWAATHIADNEMRLADNDIWSFGAAGDLKLYHNGSHSYIQDGGTGQLYIAASYLSITNAAISETMATFDDDGAVTLMYDNSTKIATTSAGVTVTGTVTATAGSTLLIKNAAGSTLKTIKGMT